MKFKSLLENILTEASKKDILINKLGVKDDQAEALSRIAGPLSIFFAYKILEMYEEEYYDTTDRAKEVINRDKISIQQRMGLVNGSNSFTRERDKMRGIMDWVRVALAGNVKSYQELSFKELYDESERWHESLGVGESKFDYNETKDIVLDFRKNGEGYYWVNLGTGNCPDEAERMGHCASTRGVLYSLRSFKKIENDHTLNKSHLTASIDNWGTLLQLKGQKNSKPTNEYHSIILPLFYLKMADYDEKYLIKDIGYEYDSSRDFKFSDLTNEEVSKLYTDRPELFTGRQEKKLLKSLGLIEPSQYNFNFTLNIHPKNAEDYIRGELTNVVYDILMGDTYQYWDNYEYAEWRSAIDYDLNDENAQRIIGILKQKNGIDEFDETDLKEIIEEYDHDDEIKDRLRASINDAEAQEYESYMYDELKSAFSEFGNVINMNDEGVTIEINLEDLISSNKIDDETMDELIERCGDDTADAECLFSELMGDGYIEKARFDVDNRWYPSIDRNNFNEILNDRLNEI
jgi:hypothetical protein